MDNFFWQIQFSPASNFIAIHSVQFPPCHNLSLSQTLQSVRQRGFWQDAQHFGQNDQSHTYKTSYLPSWFAYALSYLYGNYMGFPRVIFACMSTVDKTMKHRMDISYYDHGVKRLLHYHKRHCLREERVEQLGYYHHNWILESSNQQSFLLNVDY